MGWTKDAAKGRGPCPKCAVAKETARTPTHVICPKVDGLPEYLTAGKRYEVNNWREGFVGGAVFVFYDDHGWPKQAVHKNSFYLNGADWIPVYWDSLGTAEVTEVVDHPRHLTTQEGSAVLIRQLERSGVPATVREFEKTMDCARGAVESNQVADKDVHGMMLRGRDKARAIIKEAEDAGAK